MKFSDGERLILVMLAEVMEEMNLNREIDPSLVKTLVYNNDEWALKRKYSGLFSSEGLSDPEVKETGDILWMWRIIEHNIAELTGEEADEAKGWNFTKFTGFDGNHDRHHGIAHTMIQTLGESQDFKDRALDSHTQGSLPRYRAMYAKFDGYVKSGKASPLSFDALRDLCN